MTSRRPWVFLRFFSVVYVRSLHSVQASVIVNRFAFFAVAIVTSPPSPFSYLRVGEGETGQFIPESW